MSLKLFMSKITFLSFDEKVPPDSYWDQAMLKDILKDPRFDVLPSGGEIIVFPGAYQAQYIKQLNDYLLKLDWAILFITSDEESKFPIEEIVHTNIVIYVQYPKKGRHDPYRKLPIGYTDDTRKNLVLCEKDYTYFFSGQVTHQRRKEMWTELIKNTDDIPLNKRCQQTHGFAQGDEAKSYMSYMCRAKVAPSPAGPVSADSFRTYEALEAGAIPIADNISQGGDSFFWNYLMGEVPFPTINDYQDLPGYIRDQLAEGQEKNNRVQAWWIQYKKKLKEGIFADIKSLTGADYYKGITVVVPVSYIKSHPSIEILSETIRSIRYQLPASDIIITFDGIRDEQKEHEADYQEFIRRALFECNTSWDAIPMIFNEHVHQSGMMRKVIEDIKTPMILYIEHDTPLTEDVIDWQGVSEVIHKGDANVIRFHFEAFIPEPHKYLMIGEPKNNLLKTAQWSQRPHLASTAFYKRIMNQYFTENSRCFLEDLLHGKLANDFHTDRLMGWNQWKVFIYHPEGSIKRSYHTDGRAGGQKYDDTQIW